jgi:hypothetical protein
MKSYIRKSEFGFVETKNLRGYSYLFGDLINETNPQDDKNFREALKEFLNGIPEAKREKAKQKIMQNWKNYIDYYIKEQKTT